tara:strand:- start:2361 stop:3680 length:1320 start_codon:yes stop_codon:yes gene_type:complete
MISQKEILSEAKELDRKYSFLISTATSMDDGVPIVVKDNICTKGINTTAGSKVLKDYVPTFDAEVISKLKKAGYFVLGKTVQDEFGFGTFSTHTPFKTPKNPYDIERSCGGSSGGTAGYVKASKFVNAGLGQSTGGSISCPAAFCGVVGLTPTYGLVSRYGLIDFANSFDRIGPLTKTVKDAAKLLTIISGFDEKDSTSCSKSNDYTKYLGKTIEGMKVGILKEFFSLTKDDRIKIAVETAMKKLEKKGMVFEEVSVPMQDLVVPIYYILSTAEASTNLAKFCGMRYGVQDLMQKDSEIYNDYFSRVREMSFGEEAKRRILVGTFIRMLGMRESFYIKSLMLRQKIIKEYKKLLKKFDVLIGPTMPILPPKFSDIEKMKPTDIYAMDALTIPSSLAGLPSISIPCEEINGLPVGMQIISDHFEEGKLIRIGDAYEREKS